MASSWFLIMAFKCLHHVAWPLLALVYPMCASVQAIETDSYAQTKHLISYWILLSLIYLFEYAFMSLLPWFQLWMYIKLIFNFWLTIPDFGRASYVVNNLIRSMKLLWRKWFFEKDNFLMHAERYMKENGTEALEKLIASKNTMCRPDAEAINEIIDTDNKEMPKTNGERLQTEDKYIKDLEAIEKIEIPATKQDNLVMSKSNTVPSQIASSAKAETKGTAEIDTCGGEVPQTSTQKEVQKEWTCDLCLLTVTCEKTLKIHLNGKKHRAALLKQKDAEVTNKIIATDNKDILKNTMCRPDAAVTNEIIATDTKEMLTTNGERLQIEHKDIKNLEAIEKKEIPVTKQDIPVMAIIGPSPNASSATVETKGAADSGRAGGEDPHSSASTEKEVQKEWTCALCLVTALSEQVWNAHLNGRKHRASLQKQKDAKVTNEIIATGNKEILKTNEEKHQTEHKDIKDFEAVEKKEIHETKQDIPGMSKIEPSQNASSATVETKVTAESDRAGGEVPQNSTSSQNEVQREWTCALCLLTFTCEKTMDIHLNGRRHRAALQRQKDAEVTNQLIATDKKEILKTNGERLKSEHKDIKDLEAIEKKEIPSSKQDMLIIPKIGPSQTASSATVETKGRAESDTVGGEVTSTLKEVQKEWTCALCLVTTTSEKDLNSHFNGRKHRDACEAAALKAKKQPAPHKLQIYLPKVEVKQKNMLNSNVKNGDGIVNRGLKGTVVMDHKVQKLQNFNFPIIRPSPSTQAVRGPTPFGSPMSSPIGVPFPYHSGATPFRGPTPSPISVPFPYYGPEGSWSRQPGFTYFTPTPRLPYQDPNRR
ncbi:HVA22 protein [Trifolium repens]|nr:HVA22 protein [Trifolium repens]